MSAGSSPPPMSNDAFAGFLRLLLTPLRDAPEPTAELRAYLEYLSRVYPPEVRRSEALSLREARTPA